MKTRNLHRDPRVAIEVHDSAKSYRYVQVRGRVAFRTHDRADAHVDWMAEECPGQNTRPVRPPGEQRVLYRIEPLHVQACG